MDVVVRVRLPELEAQISLRDVAASGPLNGVPGPSRSRAVSSRFVLGARLAGEVDRGKLTGNGGVLRNLRIDGTVLLRVAGSGHGGVQRGDAAGPLRSTRRRF